MLELCWRVFLQLSRKCQISYFEDFCILLEQGSCASRSKACQSRAFYLRAESGSLYS